MPWRKVACTPENCRQYEDTGSNGSTKGRAQSDCDERPSRPIFTTLLRSNRGQAIHQPAGLVCRGFRGVPSQKHHHHYDEWLASLVCHDEEWPACPKTADEWLASLVCHGEKWPACPKTADNTRILAPTAVLRGEPKAAATRDLSDLSSPCFDRTEVKQFNTPRFDQAKIKRFSNPGTYSGLAISIKHHTIVSFIYSIQPLSALVSHSQAWSPATATTILPFNQPTPSCLRSEQKKAFARLSHDSNPRAFNCWRKGVPEP